MASVEERLAKVEREMAELRKTALSGEKKSDWISKIDKKFQGDKDLNEIFRLGKEMRDAERVEEIE